MAMTEQEERERMRYLQLKKKKAEAEAAAAASTAQPEVKPVASDMEEPQEDTRPLSERFTEGAQAFGIGALEQLSGVGVPAVLAAQDVVRGEAPEGYAKQQKVYQKQMEDFLAKSPYASPLGQFFGIVAPGGLAAKTAKAGAGMGLRQLAKVGAGEAALGAIPRNIPTEDGSALESAASVGLQTGLAAVAPGVVSKAPAALSALGKASGRAADRLVPYATGMSAERIKDLTKEAFGKDLENIDYVSNYLRKAGVIKPGRSFEETANNAVEAIRQKHKKFGKLIGLLDQEEMKYVQQGGTPNDMLGSAAQRIDDLAKRIEQGEKLKGLPAASELRDDANRLRDVASQQMFGFQTPAPAGTQGLGSITLPKGATVTTGAFPYQTQTTLNAPLTTPREDLYGSSFRQVQNYINEFSDLAPENALKIAMEKSGLPLKERGMLRQAMRERALVVSPKDLKKLEKMNKELAPLQAVREGLVEAASAARAGKSGTSQTVVPYGAMSSQFVGRGASATMSALGAAEKGLAGAATRSQKVKDAIIKNPGLFGASGQRLIKAIEQDAAEGGGDKNFNSVYFIESRTNPDLQNPDTLGE